MFWVYGLTSFSAMIDFRRQILTSKVAPRTEKVNMYLSYSDVTHTLVLDHMTRDDKLNRTTCHWKMFKYKELNYIEIWIKF